MMAELASYAAYAHPGPGWDGDGGPGGWVIVPILFWVVALSAAGYLLYRFSPRRAARTSAERTLAERFARGEIDAEELRHRRAVLRGKG